MKVKLGDISTINRQTIGNKFAFSKMKYLDTSSITNGFITNIQEFDYPSEDIPSRAQRVVKDRTIIYSTVRPRLCHYGILMNPDENLIVSTGFVTIDVDTSIADPIYIFNILRNSKITEYLGNIADTAVSSYPSISPDDLRNLELDILEDIDEQKKIGDLLNNIDKKIEINNKIQYELEIISKTLYDYWFLQFDFPNENGKPYKSSGGKMVWDEELKREIPEGWEAIKLKNIVKKTNRVYDYNKESKTYDLSIMPSNSISINDTSSSKDFETNLFAVKEGDILFGSIRPYLRKAGIASYDGAVAGTIHCYEVIKESNYNLALFTLTSENMFKYAINNSKGTKMPVITSDDLLEFMLPYNEEIAKKFNNIKIREIIIANIKQSNELASLRDFLLPLLMNGQVKFKDN